MRNEYFISVVSSNYERKDERDGKINDTRDYIMREITAVHCCEEDERQRRAPTVAQHKDKIRSNACAETAIDRFSYLFLTMN